MPKAVKMAWVTNVPITIMTAQNVPFTYGLSDCMGQSRKKANNHWGM